MDDIFNHHFMGWNKITPNIFGIELFLIQKIKKKVISYTSNKNKSCGLVVRILWSKILFF